MEALLGARAPINTRDNKGRSPFAIAVLYGRYALVRLLLKHAAEQAPPVDIISEVDTTTGRSALHYAASAGDSITSEDLSVLKNAYKLIITDLLAAKASIHPQDKEGLTPLLVAASTGKTDMVQFLLANRASLKEDNYTGDTALHLAINGQHFDVVKTLLQARANPNIANRSGMTATQLAKSKNTPLSALFPSKTDAKTQQTPIRASTPAASASSAAAATAGEAPATSKNRKKKKTRVSKAAADSNPVDQTTAPAVEPSVSSDLDRSDDNFFKTVKTGTPAQVAALLTAANIAACDLGGNTPLMVAVLAGNNAVVGNDPATVGTFIRHATPGSEIENMLVGLWQGLPLLEYSMLCGAWHVTALLLEHAVPLRLPLEYQHSSGHTAFTLAMWLWRAERCHPAIIHLFIQASQNFRQNNLAFPVKDKTVSLVNISGKKGMTPLMLAVKWAGKNPNADILAIVDALCVAEADISAKNDRDRSAKHYAKNPYIKGRLENIPHQVKPTPAVYLSFYHPSAMIALPAPLYVPELPAASPSLLTSRDPGLSRAMAPSAPEVFIAGQTDAAALESLFKRTADPCKESEAEPEPRAKPAPVATPPQQQSLARQWQYRSSSMAAATAEPQPVESSIAQPSSPPS